MPDGDIARHIAAYRNASFARRDGPFTLCDRSIADVAGMISWN